MSGDNPSVASLASRALSLGRSILSRPAASTSSSTTEEKEEDEEEESPKRRGHVTVRSTEWEALWQYVSSLQKRCSLAEEEARLSREALIY